MTRTFSPSELVSLPQLDTAGAITAGARFRSAAENQVLPQVAQRAFERMVLAHEVLRGALVANVVPANSTSERAVAADHGLDTWWAALEGVASGWRRTPPSFELHAPAQLVTDLLFEDGKMFLNLPYDEEWAQSDARIKRMEKPELAAALTRLGLAPVLPLLRAAHAEYGDALGITTRTTRPADPAKLDSPRAAFLKALREYVGKVAASVEEDQPETVELAKVLLAPLAELESKRSAGPSSGL